MMRLLVPVQAIHRARADERQESGQPEMARILDVTGRFMGFSSVRGREADRQPRLLMRDASNRRRVAKYFSGPRKHSPTWSMGVGGRDRVELRVEAEVRRAYLDILLVRDRLAPLDRLAEPWQESETPERMGYQVGELSCAGACLGPTRCRIGRR